MGRKERSLQKRGSHLVTVVNPQGEEVEMQKSNADDMVKHMGWTYPQSDIEIANPNAYAPRAKKGVREVGDATGDEAPGRAPGDRKAALNRDFPSVKGGVAAQKGAGALNPVAAAAEAAKAALEKDNNPPTADALASIEDEYDPDAEIELMAKEAEAERKAKAEEERKAREAKKAESEAKKKKEHEEVGKAAQKVVPKLLQNGDAKDDDKK